MKEFDREQHLYEDLSRWERKETSIYLKKKIRIIHSIIPDDVRTVVDVGCGNGDITETFSERWEVTGIDRSKTALSFAQVRSILGAIRNLPVKTASFDLVFCSEVIEHLPGQIFQSAIAELRRITKKYLLITVPNNEYLAKNHIKCPECGFIFNAAYHLNSFDREKLISLFPDFTVVSTFETGKLVRQYQPFLLKIKQRFGNSWARFSEKKYYICPSCNYRFEYQVKNNAISFFCNAANRLATRPKPYWLGVLFKKS